MQKTSLNFEDQSRTVLSADGEIVTKVHTYESACSLFFSAEVSVEEEVDGGQFFVGEKKVCWLGNSHSFSLDYNNVIIHAVQNNGPNKKRCLYLQIGTTDDEDRYLELWISPSKEDRLEILFLALSECSTLNPDDDHPE